MTQDEQAVMAVIETMTRSFAAGDTAVHFAPWSMQGTDPAGNPVAGNGLSVAILKRQPDGGWKMVIDNPYGDRLLAAD